MVESKKPEFPCATKEEFDQKVAKIRSDNQKEYRERTEAAVQQLGTGGAAAGALGGAAWGALGGPVGVAAGAMIGGAIGAITGAGAGASIQH